MADSFIPDSFTPDAPSKTPAKAAPAYPGSSLGLPKIPNALEAVLNPQSIPEHLISLGVTGGAIGKGGQLALKGAEALGLPAMAQKMAPAVGRVLTSGGLGAAEAVERGKPEQAGRSAMFDAALSGIVESVLGVLPGGRAAREAAKEYTREVKGKTATHDAAVSAYEWAKQQPEQAMQAIQSRVPMNLRFYDVPALSPQRMTLPEAARALGKARGADYTEGLHQLKRELNRMEFNPGNPRAGESFKARVSPELFQPKPLTLPSPPGLTTRQMLQGPEARTGLDALLTQPGGGGWPWGMGGGALIGEHLGRIPEHLATMLMWRGAH